MPSLALRATTFTLLTLAACGSGDETSDGSSGEPSSSSNGSTSAPGTAGSTSDEPTSSGGTLGGTSTGTSPTTTTTTGPGGTSGDSGDGTTAATGEETSGLVCDPTDLPRCPVNRCLEEFNFSCDECDDFLDNPTCFEVDLGCHYPALNCDMPRPCDRVWGMGYDTIEMLEDDAAAVCLLEALRDGTPGRFEVLWGEMGDPPMVVMDVYAGGGGTVLLEWRLDCEGCVNFGFFKRSGELSLQPSIFFDECLLMPDPASLIQCVFGFTMFDPESPPPADYLPPWIGDTECVSLEIQCPG